MFFHKRGTWMWVLDFNTSKFRESPKDQKLRRHLSWALHWLLAHNPASWPEKLVSLNPVPALLGLGVGVSPSKALFPKMSPEMMALEVTALQEILG